MKAPYSVRDVVFSNIEILYAGTKPTHAFKRAAISIHNSGQGRVSDIAYRDINIEETQENLIYIGTFNSSFSTVDGTPYEPGTIDNIKFINVRLTGGALMASVIAGFDAQHPLGAINFTGLLILGQPVTGAARANFKVSNANQVTFGANYRCAKRVQRWQTPIFNAHEYPN